MQNFRDLAESHAVTETVWCSRPPAAIGPLAQDGHLLLPNLDAPPGEHAAGEHAPVENAAA